MKGVVVVTEDRVGRGWGVLQEAISRMAKLDFRHLKVHSLTGAFLVSNLSLQRFTKIVKSLPRFSVRYFNSCQTRQSDARRGLPDY